MTWTPDRLEQTTRILSHLATRQWPTNRNGFRDDLIQTAWVRLMAEEYDASRGVPFGAWVTCRARWAMQDAARAQGWIRQHRFDHERELDMVSLEAPAPSGDPIGHMLAGPISTYRDPFLADRIRRAFRSLSPRLRTFLLAGLAHGGSRQAAERFGLCESRGSQLAQKARVRMREALRQQGVAA